MFCLIGFQGPLLLTAISETSIESKAWIINFIQNIMMQLLTQALATMAV